MRLTKRDGHKVWFAHGRPRGFLCPQNFCDNAYGCDKVKDRVCPYLQLLDKLAAYEDAEEQGRLVILPCKVGYTLYAPTRSFVSEFRISQFDFGGYEEPYLWVEWYLTKGITGNFRIDGIRASEIGKTVFLTRAEAEAALKGETEDV